MPIDWGKRPCSKAVDRRERYCEPERSLSPLAGFILTNNGGSSSLKCSLFQVAPPLTRVVSCMVDRIGFQEGTLTLTDVAVGTSERRTIQASPHKDCVDPLIAWLEQKVAITDLIAIGHRVVHGGYRYSQPQVTR